MVFESLVADILNRFLGSYVDNLNASQLNIGIWGGDVKLNNLDIKETALDELDLPVKLKFGYVKSLVLKIPWKNLYTEPTIVNISQLYLIIVPNQGIVYNEEKARKNELEAKQKKLTRLEENRQNRIKKHTNTDDTFTEKLVAQVIKNLQIRIKQVHLRYEDKFSNRDRPFATGVTLDSLDFQTTDENFKLTIQREAVKIFYKLIEMNNFSVYSNANSGLLSDLTDKNAIIEALQNSIATREKRPEGYKYVLEPLSVEAQLKLNQKPEADGSDWTTPKIELSTELNKLALAIGKFQYQDFLLFLEAQERFTISERYIKYRPNLTLYKEHYKEWWHFAYNCILNEQVKRRRDNWSWERMKRHTKMVRQYKDAWITFRTEKNPRTSVKETIEEAEQKLDVFNLNIARQQAEFEIDRNEDLVRVEDQPQQGWVGWAKSWFGGGAKKAEHSETDAKIMEKLEQAVTPEEKQRLFEAIDYQENTPPTDYPKEYIENIFNLTLETVVVALEDILELKFDELSAKLEQRPSANALKFDSCIKKLEMHAVDEQRRRAQSILTMTEFNKPWLCMQFETNPLEGGFDQSIELKIAPVMLKYHAPAVNKALDVFKPPESVRLHQLTALAIARYEDVKSRSATALQHMVEERKKLKMEIQIDPAIIVLSAGGIFNESKPALIAELGQLKLKTMDHASEKAYQHIKDGKMRSLMAKAYDNFQLSLSNVQLIFSDAFNSCMQARSDRYSCHHLLKPTGMTVDLMRSTIDDIQLPLIRLFGELPDVVLMISDDRLVKLLELINSIPRPEFEEEIVDLSAPVEVQSTKLRDRAKMMAIMEVNELEEVSLHQQKMDESGESEPHEKKRYKKEENYEEEETSPLLREKQIQLDMNLILNEVGIIVNTRNRPFLSAHIRHLGLNMRKRMFDMVVQAHLGSLTLEMPKIDGQGESLYLIDNEMREGGDHLIEMTYKQATDESPTFKTEFSSNEQSIDFFFHILNFNLHKEVLNELKNFNDRLQKKLARVPPPQIAQQPQPAMSTKKRTPSQSSRRSRDSSLDRKSVAKKKPTTAKPTRPGRQKKFVFKFVMHEIAAKLYAKQNDISGGIDSSADEEAILEFCAVNIQKLNLNGRMMEDGSINVDIGLNAFTMDDRRKNAKIQRLMDKKDAKSNDKFITIKYNQNTSGDKFVDVLSSKFFLMLAPEFLGVLSSFFIFHADEEEDEGIEPADIVFATPTRQNGQRASVQQKQQTGSGGTNTIVAAAQQTYAKTSPDQIIPPTAAVGTLTLNCKIYAIEVILIENSLKPDDSQAMVLYFDAIVDAKNVDGIQQMKGGIQHLKVYSTYFAKEKRHLSNYPILKELDIVFNGSVDEKKHTQNFSVSMDQVAIRVSPSVIRLLCAVSEQFTQHQKKDQAARTARAALREYADYWKPKAIEYDKFWWFKVRDSSSPEESLIDEIAEDAKNSKDLATNQQANFSINRFVITVEAGSRDFTRPMILLESVLKGSAQNWSNQLMADAEARLQISYYNEAFNIWEPVIEPVLHQHTGWQSWQLRLKIGPEEEELLQQEPSTSKAEDRKDSNAKKRVLPPKMAVRIEACEVMNITITKSLLLLINQLKESFEKAAKQITPPISRQLPGTSSYLLLNDTGLPIKVKNTETLKANIDQKPVECTMGTFIPMERIESEKANGMSEMKGGNWQMTEDQRQVELYLQLAQPETERTVNILRAEIQCIDLPKEADSGKKWVLIVDTRLENARHVVTLRSLVNFVNHLDMPIEIRSIKDMQPTNCGVVKKGAEESLNIHLPQLYTPNGEFEMRPEGDAYDWSNKFSWHDFDSIRRRTVRCDDRANVKGGIFVEIVVEEEKIRKGARSQECHTYTIHLFPPIHLINTLPVEINILEPTKQNVQRGDGIDLFNLISGIPFVFTLQYGTETYKVQMLIPTASNRGDLQVIEMHSMSTSKKLYLGIAWSCEFLRTTMTLYTPYWMVNETGKEIVYKGPSSQNEEKNKKAKPCFSCCCEISKCCKAFCHRREINQEEQYDASIHHLATENPRFLPLAKSDFLEKKTAKLRFMDSEWSPDFPLDIAGSSGRITCQSADREYEVTVDVQLCQSGLTKVVTISPFYLLQNDSKVAIEVREPNRIDQWITVPSHSVIGFWPQQKNKRKTLIARFANSIEESIQFPFTESFEGFARITNDLIGIYVIVSLSDDSSVIHMEQFVPGMSPAILMNATDIPVEYWQSGIGEKKRTLEPGKFVPFAWDDIVLEKSTDIPRIEWNSGEGSGSDVLQHNRDQSYLPSRTSTYHYCVSFLNGRQRVFLFTSDSTVSFLALQAYEMEQPNMEIEFRLHSLGISLVNNMESKEVIYMAISTTNSSKDGFWMQYRQTDHQTTLWVKLHNFQIDNQLPSAVFPCLLGMVPQPKSVVKNEPKPFLELSFVMNQSEHTKIAEIKLLDVLVQEFAIRLDQSVINEIIDLLPKESIETDYNKELYLKDMELTSDNLNKRALQTRVTQAKAYYERMHISPLMIHLSFSQGHKDDKKGEAGLGIQWEFLNLMLKSVGVTLTEIQDVTFKLAFFERQAKFYNRNQLTAEIQSHYIRQFIKQAYVLVLGLDIIGNPYGLIRDLTSGIEDFFYQPIQGAVTGPSEFVEGMTLGLHSLFSHSVGGVLGVASRITGTLGKGVAALTLDEEYQRKRLQARQKPTNLGEGIFRGVRGVSSGVFEGVTGVVSKPLEGAKKGGLAGLIKGTGKGLIGAVVRPVSGVVDLATTMADSVKTVVANVDGIKAIRPPRVFSNDKIVRPFVYEEAIGYKIFKEINKGDFAETDHFLTYGFISKHTVIVVTDKHVIEARQHELTKNWNADWCPTYPEMNKPEWINPDSTKFGVKISLKEARGGVLQIFGSSKPKGKMILFTTENIGKRVYERMLNAWESAA